MIDKKLKSPVGLVVLGAALSGASTLLSAAAFSTPVPGNAELEEIVVTAERRSTDVQATSQSISIRSGEALASGGRSQLAQMLEDVPGVVAKNTGNNSEAGLNIVIRGVQNNYNAVTTPSMIAGSATTAVYVDNVYEGIGGTYDLDRIEVLRGPQGTLYGRSATSGVVAMHTRDPSLHDVSGDALLEIGDYSLRHVFAAVNVPLSQTVAFRVAADDREGNDYYHGEDGWTRTVNGRAKLLIKPTAALSMLLSASYESVVTKSGGTIGWQTRPGTVTYVPAPVFKQRNSNAQFALQVDWNVGPGTLTYLGSTRRFRQGLGGDDSTVYLFADVVGIQVAANQRVSPLDEHDIHEVRFVSDDSSKLKWIVGATAYFNHTHRIDGIVVDRTGATLPFPPFAPALPSVYTAVVQDANKDIRDLGVYGEATYPVSDTLRVTGGARYDGTRVLANIYQGTNLTDITAGLAPFGIIQNTISGPTGHRSFSNFTYKARLEYDIAKSHLVYAMVSTGFLPGDLEVAAGPAPAGTPPPANTQAFPTAYTYQESTLTSYEVGSKNRFLNQRLQVNADVYHYSYAGYQQMVGPTASQAHLVSIPVTMNGGELEVVAQLTENDQLSAAYSIVRAVYGSKPVDFAANVVQSKVFGVVPESATVAYEHAFVVGGNSRLVMRVGARQQGGFFLAGISPANYATDAPYLYQKAQVVGDASLAWNAAEKRWSVTAYVRNFGNVRYVNAATRQSLQGAPTAQYSGDQSDPRTFGVVLQGHL